MTSCVIIYSTYIYTCLHLQTAALDSAMEVVAKTGEASLATEHQFPFIQLHLVLSALIDGTRDQVIFIVIIVLLLSSSSSSHCVIFLAGRYTGLLC